MEGPRGKKKKKKKAKNRRRMKSRRGKLKKTTPPLSSRFGPATEDFLGLEVIRISQF